MFQQGRGMNWTVKNNNILSSLLKTIKNHTILSTYQELIRRTKQKKPYISSIIPVLSYTHVLKHLWWLLHSVYLFDREQSSRGLFINYYILTSSYNIKQKQLVSHHHHKYQDISLVYLNKFLPKIIQLKKRTPRPHQLTVSILF